MSEEDLLNFAIYLVIFAVVLRGGFFSTRGQMVQRAAEVKFSTFTNSPEKGKYKDNKYNG